ETGEARPARGLRIRTQVALLGAALVVVTCAVGWLVDYTFDSLGKPVPIWWIATSVGAAAAAEVICLMLIWRLMRRMLLLLDELVGALEWVSMGDGNQRLPHSGCAEMRRVAAAFNSALEKSARRAEDLKTSSLKRLQAAIDLRETRELATAIQETALDSIIT